jgi:hypothetical protein
MDKVPEAQQQLDEEVGNMAKSNSASADNVQRMAQEAFETAAAAGAGKGAGAKKKAATGFKAQATKLQ